MLLFLIFIPVGVLAGYFLATKALLFLTAIMVLVGTLWVNKLKEMEVLVAILYWACAIIAIIFMWTTNYIVTDSTWIGDFFRGYVLR